MTIDLRVRAEGPVLRLLSGALSLALLLAVGVVLVPLLLLAAVLSAGYALLLFGIWLVRARLASWGWIGGDGRRGVRVVGRNAADE